MDGEKLSVVEVIHLFQELKRMEVDNSPMSWREGVFRQIPDEFKITVCLGCGGYSDCDCPAGSSQHLRSPEEITEILQKWGE